MTFLIGIRIQLGEGILVPVVDRESLQQLLSMGFSETRSRKALLATNNNGAEIAMEWLLEHLEDPGRKCLFRLIPIQISNYSL